MSAHDIAQPSQPDMTTYRIVRRHAVTYPEYIEGPAPGEEEVKVCGVRLIERMGYLRLV